MQVVRVSEPPVYSRPVTYTPVATTLYQRPYVVVDRRVSYGQPIS